MAADQHALPARFAKPLRGIAVGTLATLASTSCAANRTLTITSEPAGAEVRIDERETTHRFIRVGLSVAADRLDLVTAALRQAGWRPSVAGSDGGIIRIAHAHGRRPLFIVLDDPDAAEDRLVGPGAPPATSPEGRAIRARRLRRSVIPPDAVFATSRERETELGTDIESLELQVRGA